MPNETAEADNRDSFRMSARDGSFISQSPKPLHEDDGAVNVEEGSFDFPGGQLGGNGYAYDYDGFAANYELNNGQISQILAALELMYSTGKEG